MARTVRAMQEEREQLVLSPHACLSSCSCGRMRPEEDECVLRTSFQRDRDRIIHSKTFRRLKHKTQVFLAPAGDHYRTRLTHVLEVSQIARTMAVCLRLNEYLTEAIALGHDLGHTPFGHAGEYSLNLLHPRGFKHFIQSLRIVDFLENDGKGLMPMRCRSEPCFVRGPGPVASAWRESRRRRSAPGGSASSLMLSECLRAVAVNCCKKSSRRVSHFPNSAPLTTSPVHAGLSACSNSSRAGIGLFSVQSPCR